MLVALGLTLVFAPLAGARTEGRAQLAAVATEDFRVVVAATKRGDVGGAPTASATVSVSRRVAGGWRPTATYRLRGPYFWHTVTGPRAVCRLQVGTTGGRANVRPFVVVQLLQSPSLGCGPPQRFALERG
jgi:hypothetical protein